MTHAKTPRQSLKKILIVDDDEGIREILATQLSRLHYETVTAADGVEGVSAFIKEKPDLVLMDILMPRMDGLTACEKIRSHEKKKSRTPILFLSARDTPHQKLNSAISGGDDFVCKPISMVELRQRVDAALAHAKTRASDRCQVGNLAPSRKVRSNP